MFHMPQWCVPPTDTGAQLRTLPLILAVLDGTACSSFGRTRRCCAPVPSCCAGTPRCVSTSWHPRQQLHTHVNPMQPYHYARVQKPAVEKDLRWPCRAVCSIHSSVLGTAAVLRCPGSFHCSTSSHCWREPVQCPTGKATACSRRLSAGCGGLKRWAGEVVSHTTVCRALAVLAQGLLAVCRSGEEAGPPNSNQ